MPPALTAVLPVIWHEVRVEGTASPGYPVKAPPRSLDTLPVMVQPWRLGARSDPADSTMWIAPPEVTAELRVNVQSRTTTAQSNNSVPPPAQLSAYTPAPDRGDADRQTPSTCLVTIRKSPGSGCHAVGQSAYRRPTTRRADANRVPGCRRSRVQPTAGSAHAGRAPDPVPPSSM